MDSIIERQRSLHEELEKIEQAAVDLRLLKLTTHRHQLGRDHKLKELLDSLSKKSSLLLEMYQDDFGLRKKEIEKKSEDGGVSEFYNQLAGINSYYRRNPGQVAESLDLEYAKYNKAPETKEESEKRLKKLAKLLKQGNTYDPSSLTFGHSKLEKDILERKAMVEKLGQGNSGADRRANQGGHRDDADDSIESLEEPEYFMTKDDELKLDALFSGEESMGRYLDLVSLHETYQNLKGVTPIPYLSYLLEFLNFDQISPKTKRQPMYNKYLHSLVDYFEGFISRSNPLATLDEVREIHKRSKNNTEAPEEKTKEKDTANEHNSSKIYCKLCDKYFEKRTTFNGHLKGKKHLKAVNIAESQASTTVPGENMDSSKLSVADLENKAEMYGSFLNQAILDTIANVERKQSLTEQERNQEAELEDYEVQVSSDEESEHIYNPLKLPLGWDGKPIPYWLYKLHGLRVEYNCEICGNLIYRGRKAYDLHFQEARHSTNMRKLGIPNTRQFHDISRIEDAVALWERVKQQKNQTINTLDTFEEFEDTEGNVFNRKTYEDLKRQGLL